MALATSACTFRVASVEVPTSAADLAVGDPSPPDLALLDLALTSSSADDLAMSPPTPILSGEHTAIPATVDLTGEGTLDWLHAGMSSPSDLNHKAGGAPLMMLTTKGTVGQYGMYQPTYTWNNGTPTASASSKGGIYINGVGNGFTVTLPASATTRTVNVYVTSFNVHATLTAHLSDGAVADYTDTQVNGTANTFVKYTITVRDGAPNAQLAVTWSLTQAGSGYASVDFMAATLQ